MKKALLTMTALAMLLSTSNAISETKPTIQVPELTGDVRLACEAILCLSSGTRPGECAASLARYFGISFRKFGDTLRGRINFLNLCPVSAQTPQMTSLVSAIAHGAGRCDSTSLNTTLREWREVRIWVGGEDGYRYEMVIGNNLPDYCSTYTGHNYTDFKTSGTDVKYVGTPEREGYWVETRNYAQAQAEYDARIQAEDRARRNRWMWGG